MSLFWCQAIPERLPNDSVLACNVTPVSPSDSYGPYNGSHADDSMATGDRESEAAAHFTRFLHQYVIFVISLAGIVGNCLSAIVLRCDAERREARYMLLMLAIADTAYLVSALLFYPLKYALTGDVERYLAVKVVAYPLLRTCQAATIWLTVLATVERYIYVTRPFDAQRLFTTTSRRLYALGVFAAAVAFTAPRFAEYCIERYVDECSGQTVHVFFSHKAAFLNNRPYRNFYNLGAYLLLLYILPLATLSFMNLRLVSAVRASLRKRCVPSSGSGDASPTLGAAKCDDDSTEAAGLRTRAGLTPATAAAASEPATVAAAGGDTCNSKRAETNASLVLVTIVVVFICCQTPELVIKLLVFWATVTETNEHLVPGALHSVNELLMVVNSSINFVIYTVFRRRFRSILCSLLTCQRASSSHRLFAAGAVCVPMINAHARQHPPRPASLASAKVTAKRPARVQNVH